MLWPTPRMEIHGTVAPGFEPAARAFRENFAARGEVGASFCAYHRGVPVVDLWAGFADARRRRPWRADTLCVIFSATKGLAAAAVLGAAHRGLIDYDAPVAGVWPELARGRLRDLTLRHLMNHRAGLVTVDEPISLRELADPDRLSAKLERQTPHWSPGEMQGYHGVTYGLYLSEIFRRTVGRSLGHWLRDEVTGPLGADAFLGLPPELDPRVATLIPVGRLERIAKLVPHVIRHDTVERRLLRALLDKRSLTTRAFAHPAALGGGGLHRFNDPAIHRLELAWAS
ncbi:MAG: serine hydrolase domain-containing protein, partial [Acidobacteriota bacterium]